ncbi:hypothetical protein Bca4012_094176 [Brassica carinata]|uniref:DUF4220 domain-containing protein n=2 Tax=Brassica TaxID=3705 RepID=A0A8X7TWI3_BRACI|nr:uncharacterized protein LOC106413046 [Brassica napus]KAG2256997.1 hypothetical protein Bca52824_076291 [Brassica carinata]CAF2109063.1 unnamed protein product [Brassica napus]
MGQVLPEEIKNVWERWNIRGMLILSLSLQTILILFAPTRKRASSKSLTILLWSCYLLADWSANFAAGLISKNQWTDPKPNQEPRQNQKLMALWSPFLLLHLGGPDTITAFSLEDNALWTRHMLGLIFQAFVCVFVVFLSLPNPLWPSILLLFTAGIIKYLERTMALSVASSGKFRHSGIQTKGLKRSDVEEGLEEPTPTDVLSLLFWIFRSERRPMEIAKPDRDLTDLETVQHAFTLYRHFTSLISNFVFSFRDLKASQALFNVLNPQEALMVLGAELCFIYDALYTKSPILHTKKGFLFRVIASGSLVWSFCKFHYRDKKKIQEFQHTDVIITYMLFLAGLTLDFISTLVFLLSDWKLAVLCKPQKKPNSKPSRISIVLNWILGFKSLRWEKIIDHGHEVIAGPVLLRRWAGKIYAFNFFNFFLKTDGKINVRGRRDSPYMMKQFVKCIHGVQCYIVRVMASNKVAHYILYPVKAFVKVLRFLVAYVIDRLDVKEFIDDMRVEGFVSSEPMTKTLWSFVFEQVRHKSKFADTEENTKTICSARGEWTLRENRCSRRLIHYVENVDYDETLLLWHIATEICYQEEEEEEPDEHREFSKTLSDYMMYLMILQPQLMSEVAGLGMLRFKDAMVEAEELLEESFKKAKDVKLAGEKIVALVNGGVSGELGNESILEGASSIVRELKQMQGCRNKWKILSRVWVELICFASLHCDATARLELLSKGGELFAFAWLLMAHFGLVD